MRPSHLCPLLFICVPLTYASLSFMRPSHICPLLLYASLSIMPPPSICAPLTLCPPSFRNYATGLIIGETSLLIENAKTHNPFPFSVSHSQLRSISLHPLFPHYRFQTPGLDDYAPLLLLHIAQTRPTTIIHWISTTRIRVTTSKSPSPGDVAHSASLERQLYSIPTTRRPTRQPTVSRPTPTVPASLYTPPLTAR